MQLILPYNLYIMRTVIVEDGLKINEYKCKKFTIQDDKCYLFEEENEDGKGINLVGIIKLREGMVIRYSDLKKRKV